MECQKARVSTEVYSGEARTHPSIVWDGRIDPRTDTRSLITMRSVHEHAVRRKRWNRAFNTASVKGYEPIVKKRALQLVEELDKRSSLDGGETRGSIDLSQWLTFFTCVTISGHLSFH